MTTSTSPILLVNPIPQTIIVLGEDILIHANKLVDDAKLLPALTDGDSLRQAETIYSQIKALTKEIDTDRLAVKRPLLDLGKQIDEAAGEALAPLAITRTALGKKIDTYIQEENARRRKEAEAAQVKMRAEQAEREKIRMEQARLAALANPATAPEPDEAPRPEPIVQIKAIEIKSSSIKRVVKKKLVINNPDLIPRELLDPNEKKIDALLRAGIAVPGCSLEDDVPRIDAK